MIEYILLIILSVIICKYIHIIYKHNQRVGVLSGVLFSFLLYYCIVPLLILLNYSKIEDKTTFITTVYESSFESYLLFFICFLLLLCMMTDSYGRVLMKGSVYTISQVKTKKYSRILFCFTFVVGVSAFIIYINAFGGMVNAIIQAESMRSFGESAIGVIPYRAALMQLPSSLVTACPLFYAIWIGDDNKWRLKNKFIFILLLLINVPYLLINAGKTGVILFVLSIWLTLISYKIKHEWILTIIMCVLGVFVINVLDLLFLSFANETSMLTADDIKTDFSLLHQFAYPISNALNMHEILQNNNLRFFKDFLTGFLTHVPGLNFDVSYVPTSAFYAGADWREMGGTPNDIMTFAYLQLGPIGIAVVGVIWGYVLGFIETYLKKCSGSFSSRFIKYSLILTVFNAVMNADIAALVVNFKLSLLILFIYISLSPLRTKKSVSA